MQSNKIPSHEYPIKCVIVGDQLQMHDERILQANLVNKFCGDNDEYEMTLYSIRTIQHLLRGKNYAINLWIIDGQHDYDRLRPLSYTFANLVILLFSYDDINSFNNIENKWHPEVSHYVPNAKLYLVGLHGSYENEAVTENDAVRVAKKLKMIYLDSSLLEAIKIRSTFNEIFDDFVNSMIALNKWQFSFFADNFFPLKDGLKFAEKVAHLTRATQNDNGIFTKLSLELLFLILIEAGKPLLKNDNNTKALMQLIKLVAGNALTAKASTGKDMIWRRQFLHEFKDSEGRIKEEWIRVYPEPENNPKSKRCVTM